MDDLRNLDNTRIVRIKSRLVRKDKIVVNAMCEAWLEDDFRDLQIYGSNNLNIQMLSLL